MLLLLTTLLGCSPDPAPCLDAKAEARKAWGEVAVRYGLALKAAEDAVKEPQGRLAALERRPDAPAEGKAALAAEVAKHQAAIEAARPPAETAERISAAFASQGSAEAQATARSLATGLQGADVQGALAKGDAAVAACVGIE